MAFVVLIVVEVWQIIMVLKVTVAPAVVVFVVVVRSLRLFWSSWLFNPCHLLFLVILVLVVFVVLEDIVILLVDRVAKIVVALVASTVLMVLVIDVVLAAVVVDVVVVQSVVVVLVAIVVLVILSPSGCWGTCSCDSSNPVIMFCFKWFRSVELRGGGGVYSAYERGGYPRQKFWIKPVKETDLGMAQAFFDP